MDRKSDLGWSAMTRKAPKIIEVNAEQVEQLLERASSNTLGTDDVELLRQILDSYEHVFQVVGKKNTTIARLRKLLFGDRTEKASNILGDDDNAEGTDASGNGDSTAAEPEHSADDSNADSDEVRPDDTPADAAQEDDSRAPGHGRYGVGDYQGANRVDVPHPCLCAGDDCPKCQRGTLYRKNPSVFVRFTGQAPLQATTICLERLRCNLCGQVFIATPPAEMGEQKYDHTVASMIGLLKYGSGLPFNRLQRLQGNCQLPLAASTQWEIVSSAASLVAAAHEELIRQAAQGEIVYNDDTTVKILELMGERAEQAPPENDQQEPDRSGLFTSGVVATCAGRQIAVFVSGRQHAGENLEDVLKHRAAQLDPPIQMCDGLSRNIPKQLETILANCIAHGRRKFVELFDSFSDECRYVIKAFKVIYAGDQLARRENMSAEERLAYHQTHSQATMDDLQQWLQRQFDEKLVEPNSALGEAINYLLRRWESLTLFLRKAGAPLDNNICERALKKAILHRKNSLFYKTRNGARVGDIYMSLIHTCELNAVNAFDYLNELQLNASEVAEHPEQWMPWNYGDKLAAAGDTTQAPALA
jgi:hypothetical protein